MNKCLYVTDIDGTLLNSQTELSTYSKEVLTSLLQHNVNISVASLRSIISISNLFADIPFKLPVIEMNGSFITDFITKQKLVIHNINSALKNDLLQFIYKQGMSPVVQCYHNDQDLLYFGDRSNKGIGWYYNTCKENGDPRLHENLTEKDILEYDWIGITIIDTPGRLKTIYQSISQEFNNIYTNITKSLQTPGHNWLTIHSDRSNKQNALLKLKEHLNMQDYYTVVFGDQPVDIPMFSCADLAVAVANAHPEVKEKADIVIGSNDTDAVMKFIASHCG